MVVKSDGTVAISSDAIKSQTNPLQLMMLSTSDGNTSLYMVPKDASSSQTAFLVKPIVEQNWSDDQKFSSLDQSVRFPYIPAVTKSVSSSEIPARTKSSVATTKIHPVCATIPKSLSQFTTTYNSPMPIYVPNVGPQQTCMPVVARHPLLVPPIVQRTNAYQRLPPYTYASAMTHIPPYRIPSVKTTIKPSTVLVPPAVMQPQMGMSLPGTSYFPNKPPFIASNTASKSGDIRYFCSSDNGNPILYPIVSNVRQPDLPVISEHSVGNSAKITDIGNPFNVQCTTYGTSPGAMDSHCDSITPVTTVRTKTRSCQRSFEKHILGMPVCVNMSGSQNVPCLTSPKIVKLVNTNTNHTTMAGLIPVQSTKHSKEPCLNACYAKSNIAKSSSSECSLNFPKLPELLKSISPEVFNDTLRSDSVSSPSSYIHAQNQPPTLNTTYHLIPPAVNKSTKSIDSSEELSIAHNPNNTMQSGQFTTSYSQSALPEKPSSDSNRMLVKLPTSRVCSSVKTVSKTQTSHSSDKMPTRENSSEFNVASIDNMCFSNEHETSKLDRNQLVASMVSELEAKEASLNDVTAVLKTNLKNSKDDVSCLLEYYNSEYKSVKTSQCDASKLSSICDIDVEKNRTSSANVFACNEESDLKISAVFSLCPSAKSTEKTDLKLKPEDRKQDVKKPTTLLNDPPSKNMRQTTKDSTKAITSIINQKLNGTLKRIKIKQNTSYDDCRVVLRYLKVNDTKKSYPYAEFRKKTCSKRCRVAVTNAYFKLPKDMYPDVSRSECFNPIVTFCAGGSKAYLSDYKALQRRKRIAGRYAEKTSVPSLYNCNYTGSQETLSKTESTYMIKDGLDVDSDTLSEVSSDNVSLSSSKPMSPYQLEFTNNEVGDTNAAVLPTSSFENAFARECGLSQGNSPSRLADVLNQPSSTSNNLTNKIDYTNLNNVLIPICAHSSAQLTTLTDLHSTDTTFGLASEAKVPSESKSNCSVDSSILKEIKIKQEPVDNGYSDEQSHPFYSRINSSRKRKLAKDLSKGGQSDAINNLENDKSKILKPFAISETPQSERVRRLKEQLKQTQVALEEVRRKRFFTSCKLSDSDV